MARRQEITAEMIKDWFTIGKESRKLEMAGSATGGFGLEDPTRERYVPPSLRRCSSDTDSDANYVHEYLAQENAALQKRLNNTENCEVNLLEPLSQLNVIEETTTTGGCLPNIKDLDSDLTQVYNHYDFTHRYNSKLLISNYKEDIVRAIETQQVVVIEGATGSGKTTQVPQYLLDHYVQLRRHCNIIVTQPRRLAAISIAKRVCSERGWTLGGLVGYQVGMEKQASHDTRLTYVTTGVFLQHLISNKDMNHFTHVILDEVHERDQDMDFSLLLVRKFLHTVSRHVKVVLMSATFDVDLFGNYFSLPIGKKMEKPITISLEGKSYAVSEHWIDDLVKLGPVPDLDYFKPTIPPESYKLAYKLIEVFDKIEIREQEREVNGLAVNRGSVLIFLPGLEEIHQFNRMLMEDGNSTKFRWWILPLHSTITTEEQGRVFELPQPGYRKIILSTNIAESSVTVSDIKYVIDFCLTKNLFCDPESNYTNLRLEWASKANCKQRKGRAGRVATGRVYRMIPCNFYDSYLPEFIVPELKRCPLEKVVLKIKLLDLAEPKALLALALEPPRLSDIERAILTLKEIGALDLLTHGEFYPYDGDLTFIGKILGSLPLDIHLGKLIALGFVFGCLEECVIISAGLSLKSCFSNPLSEQLLAYKNKVAWALGSFSDCIGIMNAYKVWQSKRRNHGPHRVNDHVEKMWCRNNFLQHKRLKEMDTMVQELTERLERLNMRSPNFSLFSPNETDKTLILKMVIAGAFYPHYFLRDPPDEETVVRTLSGHNPLSTVTISGLPSNQGILYDHALKSIFQNLGFEIAIHYEDTKAFIEFDHKRNIQEEKDEGDISNQILPMVYLAVKMRLLRMPLHLNSYSPEELKARMQQLELLTAQRIDESHHHLRTNRISTTPVAPSIPSVQLPKIDRTVIEIMVTEVVRCGHFWAHYGEDDTFGKLRYMQELILRDKDKLEPLPEPISAGLICLAPYTERSLEYYRARIEAIKGLNAEILFVDYGNLKTVAKTELRAINADIYPMLCRIPMQSFECQLSGIKPSSVRCPLGTWTLEAKQAFAELVRNKILHARVYSVVHNIIHLELVGKKDGRDFSVNDELIKHGFAEAAEESILSKQNHMLRQKYQDTPEKPKKLMNNDEPGIYIPCESEILSGTMCSNKKIKLRGPSTPLEFQYSAMTRIGRMKQTQIDQNSVNSVSLDPDPQDKFQRLMVAANSGLNPSGTKIVARDTNLMPKIHGLPALLCLLFSPFAELRCDSKFSRYTGALCGLGYDSATGEALYPEHDIEVTFDTNFNNDDLVTINAIRLFIHHILQNVTDSNFMQNPVVGKTQIAACERFLNLLKKPRRYVEEIACRFPFRWKRIPENRLLKPGLHHNDQESEHKFHCGITLTDEDDEKIYAQQMLEHVKELHGKASRSLQQEPTQCELCSLTLNSPHELLFHLKSSRHTELEKRVFENI